ncbi:LysM peptidoglycan-binding domain-containing protein [Nocardioides zhouii]|uniref:LysM peptidoglycan-binding domain-containing protein n=1 Tax=Nocardioides zhouii TaxID=1168729 RepID=UPI001A92657B|nr:LysM peptidoglycan-binding domain-containing protein [Nocardioides zhouii]
MSREATTTLRPLAVWLLVTVATGAAALAVPATWAAASNSSGTDAVADLLVATCATALALALGWLWLVATVTVAGLLTGRVRTGGATRRLVLVACGVAVVAGTSVPALASGGDGRELLSGLALPERAVAAAHHQPRPADATYVVRPGDSLSSIALTHPGTGSLEDRWRAIWQANRDVVGDDPDLIHPGQALRLPGTHPLQQDGDRS